MGNDIAKYGDDYVMSKKQLGEMLESLSKEQLLRYIKQFSDEFDIVNSFFQLEFAPLQKIYGLSCNHMNYYINTGLVNGKIPSQNVEYVIRGGEQVLEKASKCSESDPEQAVLLCVAVLSCYIPILSHSDDQIDGISFLIDRCINNVSNITLNVAKKGVEAKEKIRIYEIIRAHVCETIYDNWIDWRADLLYACVCLAGEDSIKTSLYDTVDEIIDKLPDNKWYKKYVTKRLKEIIYNIIKTFDGPDSAHNFVWENLDYDNFRDIAINLSMIKKDYRTVAKLCTDGLKISGVDSARIFEWKNDMLEAYRALGDVGKRKAILEDFILQGKIEYYSELKSLYSPGRWDEEFDLIVSLLKDDKLLHGKYLDLLIIENKQDLVVEHCLANPRDILYVYARVDAANLSLLNESFESYIFDLTDKSFGRSDYKIILELLNDMRQNHNQSLAEDIAVKLSRKYSRKTSLIEQLKSVFSSNSSDELSGENVAKVVGE